MLAKYRYIFYGLVFVSALTISKMSPGISYLAWSLFAIVLAWLLYYEYKTPTNYQSLKTSLTTIEYTVGAITQVIELRKVVRVEFKVQEMIFNQGVESKWVFHSQGSDEVVEIEDELQDRSRLIHTLESVFPKFSNPAVGLKPWRKKEGVWICYQAEAGSGNSRQEP